MRKTLRSNPVDDYAQTIVSGSLPAGKYHRLACARHLKDRQREQDPTCPFRFEIEHAERFFRFAEKLRHYKGEWAGQPIRLTPFQQFRLGSVFGWRQKANGLRRFTTAYNELPRKQGKSLEAAIIAIYATFFEGEPGAEGYCLATKEKQATDVVFRDIKRLIQSSALREKLTVQVKNIHRDDLAQKLEPLGSDSDTLDGLNPHVIITDELHAFKTRGLLDVMESATGARRNPLHYQITTAGDDPVSVCGDQHEYACKILDGIFEDVATDAFFCCIAHADLEDDWLDERTWRKANPHADVSVSMEDMRKLALKAKHMPSAAAEFQQKRLNWWVNQSAPCLSLDGWRRGQSRWDENDLLHEPCYLGVDLASQLDLCALALLFPPCPGRDKWRVISRIWTPEETLGERALRDRAPYDQWAREGWLIASPGASLDHEDVRQAIVEARSRFDIQQIGFDPWHASSVIKNLVSVDGFAETEVIAVPQTYAGMSAACLAVQAEIASGLVDARGCPVTAWAVSNVVDQRDGKDNCMFTKKKSRGRIDPVIALTIARSLVLRRAVQPEASYQMFVMGGR